MDDLYSAWNTRALEISEGKIPKWKGECSEVYYMLEHVNPEDAIQFARQCLEEGLTLSQIQTYATLCDSIGGPTVYQYPALNLTFSTTCIRYLYHATQIVKMQKGLPIVEIGGGYGGLALAVNYVAAIKNVTIPVYVIIDLPNVQKLQEYYLNQFKLNFPVFFSNTYEAPCYLVSNYALAEMGETNRQNYIRDFIIPYVQEGFLVWNSGALYEFLQQKYIYTVEHEKPQTGPNNKVIQFKLK